MLSGGRVRNYVGRWLFTIRKEVRTWDNFFLVQLLTSLLDGVVVAGYE